MMSRNVEGVPRSEMSHDDIRNIILNENRSTIRIQLKLNAWYCLDRPHTSSSIWHPCTILNISTGGVRITTAIAVQTEEIKFVSLKFNIGQEYLLPAKIIWEQRIPQIYQYGLCWYGVPNHTHEHLMWAITRLAVRRRRMKKK